MSDTEDWVWVYDYEYWDEEKQQKIRSLRPATSDAIRNGLGILIPDSGRKVPRDSLDVSGRMVRIPSPKEK